MTTGNKDNILFKATINDYTNYNINISDNPYIEENILTSDKAYITDIIDKININYKYQYQLNVPIELSYKYRVIATIVASDELISKPIWTKDYNLLDKEYILSNSQINIEEIQEIYLDQFNSIVNKFQEEFEINSTVNLEVKLIVDIIHFINDQKINKSHIITINIPLNVKTFDITLNKNFAEEETEYINPLIDKETIFVNIIINISLIITIIALFIFLIKYILNKHKSPYILERNKILKEYDNRIVEVTNFVKYTKWETVEVKNIKELIELSNEAFEPIFFLERKKGRQKEAWFCILKDSVLYKFVLFRINPQLTK